MCEKNKQYYGFYIHKLAKSMRYLTDDNLTKNKLTIEQVKIIRYLYKNRVEKYVYQKDIEKEFDIKRSSVTNILQNMEKKHLILRSIDEKDARVKKVELTEKGQMMSSELTGYIEHLEEILVEGMTEEEKDLYLILIKRSIENIKTLM
jgi:DNA-binding MarR family transcriptional regulator